MTKFYGDIELHNNITELSKKSRIQRIKEVREQEKLLALERSQDFRKYVDERKQIKYEKKVQLKKQQLIQEKLEKMKELEYCLVKTGEAHRNAKDEVKVFQQRLQSKERKYYEDEEKVQQRHQYALKVMKEEREIEEKETAQILHLKTLREQSRKEEREDAHYYAEHRAVREEVGRQGLVRKYQRALTPRSAERVHERFPTEVNPTVVRHTMSDTNIVSNNATIQERVTLRKSWRAIMDELRRKRVMKEREKEAIQTHRQNRGARFLEEELQLLTLVDKSRHRIKETAQVEVEEEAEEVRGDATKDEFERIFMSTMAVKRRPTTTASASSPSPQRQTSFSTIPSTLYLSNKPPPPSMPDDFSVTSSSEDSLQSSGSWRLHLRQQSGKREVESKTSTNVKASAGGASAPLPRLPPPLPLAPPAYEMSERDQRASIDRSPSTDHDAQEEDEEEEEVVVQTNQRHQEQISDLQQHSEEKKEERKEEKKEVLRREEEESSSEDSDQDESSDDNDNEEEEEAEEMKEEFKKPFPAKTIPSRETALTEARELSRQRQELEQRERMKIEREQEREREREKTARDWSRAEVSTTSSLLQEQWKQRNEEGLTATHPQRQQPGHILPPPLPMTSRENIQTTSSSYMPAPRPISIPMHPRYEEVANSQPLPVQEPPQLPTLRGFRVPAEPLRSADQVERRTHQTSSTTAIATSTAFTTTNTLNTSTGSSTVQRKESASPVVSFPVPPSLPSNKIPTTKKEESFLSMTSATSTRSSSSTKSSSSSSSSPSISLASSISETQSKGFAEQLTSHILQHSLNQAVEVERDEARHMMTSTSISTASLDHSESTISETGIEVEIAPQTAPRQLNLNMTGSDYHSLSSGESSTSSSRHSTQSSPSSTPSSSNSNVSRSSSSSSSRERRDQYYMAATTATVTAPAGTSFTSSPSSQSSNSSSQPILLLKQPLHSTSSTSSTPSSTSYSSHGLPPLPSPLEKPQHFSMTQLLQHDQTVNEIQREIVEMRQRLLSAVSYPSFIPAPAMTTMLSPSTPSFALSSSASSPPPLSPKSDDVSTNTSDISNILDSREHESSRLTSSKKKLGGEERESLSTGSLNSKDLLSLRTSSSSSASVFRFTRTTVTSQAQGKAVTSLQRELTATPTDSTASSHSSDSLAQWMTSSKQAKEKRDVNTTLLTSDEEEEEEEEERFRQQKKQFQQKLQEKRNYLLTSSLNLATTTSTTTTTIVRQSTTNRVVGRSSANADDRSLSSGSLLQSALDVTLSSEDDDVSSVGQEKRKLIVSNATSSSMSPRTPSLSQEYLQATSATLSSRTQTHLLATPSTPSSSSSISSSRLQAMRSKIASDVLSEDSLSF